MNALKRCILVLLATGWMVLMTGQANAAVCFAGDQSCGGAGSFDGNYVNPVDDARKQCLEAGFTLGSECTPLMGKQIAGYCPYSSEYVTCCGLEYAYSGCVYPYVNGAAPVRCGKRYRCKCDPAVYKYDSIATCRTAGYPNARPGGTSCTHVKALDSVSIQNELLFKDCVCDRGLYPYSQKDCNTNGANADEAGSKCVSNITDGEGDSTYYASCKCDIKKYPETNDSCEFGGTGKHCVQAGLWFFENCCSCKKFPAKGTRERGPDDPNVDRSKNSEGDQVGYDICPCVKGYTRFKIKKCNEGWEPNPATYDTPAGSKCQRVSCEEAIKLLIKRYPSSSAGVFTGTDVLGYSSDGSTYSMGATAETAIVSKNVYASSNNCSYSGGGFNPIRGNIGIGCIKAAEYKSGYDYAKSGYTLQHQNAKESCKVITPTINYSGASFPISNEPPPVFFGSNPTISLYGVRLNFTSTSTIKRRARFYDTDLTSSYNTISFNKSPVFGATSGHPQYGRSIIDVPYLYFYTPVDITGYNLKFSSMYLSVPDGYKDSSFGTIEFLSGQTMRGGTFYFGPEYDDTGTHWGSTMTIKGPYSGTANIYSNIYAGYQNGKTARSMSIGLEKGVNLNLFEGANYKIGLSNNSRVSVKDSTGNYAKIMPSTTDIWKSCSLMDGQPISHKRGYLGCGFLGLKCCEGQYCQNTSRAGGLYIVCTINKDKSTTNESSMFDFGGRLTYDSGCKWSIPSTSLSGCVAGVHNCDTVQMIDCS